MADSKQLKPLRESLQEEWFLTWKQGTVYGIPKVATPSQPFGQPATLRTDDYLGLAVLNARANELLPALVPKYQSTRQRHRRGIHFVAQRTELVHISPSRTSTAPTFGDTFPGSLTLLLASSIARSMNRRSGAPG